jgi:hypothetical protein
MKSSWDEQSTFLDDKPIVVDAQAVSVTPDNSREYNTNKNFKNL